jgi:hypothetical protein
VDLEARVRSYLDVNCAYCHFPDGGTPHSFDARAYLPTTSTNMLYGNVISEGAPNDTDHIIRPGNKAESSIWNKINARTATNGTFNSHSQMPPLASNRLDPEGIALIAEWIDNYANVAPTLLSTPTASTTEDTPIDTTITSAGATDPDVRGGLADQSQLTFAITGGNTEAHFAIDPDTGEITVAKALDYEQTNAYAFEITVSDNFAPNPLATVGNIMVNVTDVAGVDEDGNGVPDVWEELFGISGAPIGNDEDKDGLPDFFELITGSNPITPLSFSVIALDPLAPGGTTYSWRYDDDFELGIDYLLQGTNSMTTWLELRADVDYEVVSNESDGNGYHRLTIRLLNPTSSRYFLRLSSP